MNKRGPRPNPCGTSQSKLKRSERDSLMETHCPLLAKYDLNHSKAIPHIPNSSFRRVSRKLWLTLSKAALRSSMTNKVISWLFIFMRISFLTLTRAVSILWFDGMMTETRDIVNDLSYGCVLVCKHRLLSQLRDILLLYLLYMLLTVVCSVLSNIWTVDKIKGFYIFSCREWTQLTYVWSHWICLMTSGRCLPLHRYKIEPQLSATLGVPTSGRSGA